MNTSSAGISGSLSSAGIQIEKARNVSGLTDEDDTPLGSRQVGLKPSIMTVTTVSGDREQVMGQPSVGSRGNVIVIDAETTKLPLHLANQN